MIPRIFLLLTTCALPLFAKTGDTLEQSIERYGEAVYADAERRHYVFKNNTMLLAAVYDDDGKCMVFSYLEFGEDGIAGALAKTTDRKPPTDGLPIPTSQLKKLMKFNEDAEWKILVETEEKSQWQTKRHHAVFTKGKFVIIDRDLYKAWRKAHPKDAPEKEQPAEEEKGGE